MKVLIVEDEDVAARNLQQMLLQIDPTSEVVSIIQSKKEFVQWWESGTRVDLLFCDIELRDGNVLEFLKDHPLQTAVIFTTAYDQFWSTALHYNGIDYLLKPIDEKKLRIALNKVLSLKQIFSHQQEKLLSELAHYFQNRSTITYKKRFPVRVNNEVLILDIDDIQYFKITNGVILAHTLTGKKLPMAEATLNELESQLDPKIFFRINRSELVHIQFIESIYMAAPDEYLIKLKGGHGRLAVSSTRIAQLKSWINQ